MDKTTIDRKLRHYLARTDDFGCILVDEENKPITMAPESLPSMPYMVDYRQAPRSPEGTAGHLCPNAEYYW